jgi:glutamate synthase domain-containing protein 3
VAEVLTMEIDARGLTTRDLNRKLRESVTNGEKDIVVKNPAARHNLAVAVLEPGHIRFDGSVGYYCAGLSDGISVEIDGSAGWGLAESMMSGNIRVHGSAGNGAAAAVRGGTVVIEGNAAARLGVSMKGGTIVVLGDCGYMAGFMGQKGTLVVCGNAGDAFGDSMYETVCYVGGEIRSLGTDAVVSELTGDEESGLESILLEHVSPALRARIPGAGSFRKVAAGRKLWNFDQREWKIWQEAL